MDDGMLGDGMTLDAIGKQLRGIQEDLTTVKNDVGALKSDVGTLKSDVGTLKGDVGTLKGAVAQLQSSTIGVHERLDSLSHRMTIEFEDTRRMLSFGLEAREALRESMEQRFTEVDVKQDKQIGLLKDVLRDVREQAGRR